MADIFVSWLDEIDLALVDEYTHSYIPPKKFYSSSDQHMVLPVIALPFSRSHLGRYILIGLLNFYMSRWQNKPLQMKVRVCVTINKEITTTVETIHIHVSLLC
jgi:hypothetical protein